MCVIARKVSLWVEQYLWFLASGTKHQSARGSVVRVQERSGALRWRNLRLDSDTEAVRSWAVIASLRLTLGEKGKESHYLIGWL